MKTVLITGASRGIGLSLVTHYLQAGWGVIACCRVPTRATQLQDLSSASQLQILPLDVTKDHEIQKLASQLSDQAIDILINNAGISGPESEELESAAWMKTFHTNTVAPYLLSYALLPSLLKGEDKIIANLSSVYASITLNIKGQDACAYRSSKTALNSMTKCLSHQLKDQGITVIALHPGSVRTDMNLTGRITVKESAEGIFQVLSQLSIQETGTFVDYQNKTLPW